MYTKKILPKSQVEFTITVLPTEYSKDLEQAAERISQKITVKGFRKGHIPYDIVRKEVGDMAILEEALSTVIGRTFAAAIKEEGLDSLGMPQIKMDKVAPDNEIVYTATVALLPAVTLPDISRLSVTPKPTEITEEMLQKTLRDLQDMHAAEAIRNDVAREADKVVVDLNMSLDGVPVDGGQAKDYHVHLGQDHYIPGFNQKLIGAKKGEEKNFSLSFPKTHYQKHLAGKKVDFTVRVKDVYERTLPELTDEFAKRLGQESAEKLTALMRSNLEAEARKKAEEAAEIELLDLLLDKSAFEEIPEVLVDAERQKMFYELKRDLDRHGIEVSDYLRDLKKTEQEVFDDFKLQAEKRAKAALALRMVAKQENLVPSNEEIDAELSMLRDVYKENAEYLENFKRPEVRETIATQIQNRKVMAFLKERAFKKET